MSEPESQDAAPSGGFSKGQRTVVVTAGMVVLVYGLHLAADLMVPFMVSLFLAAVCFPLVHTLVRWRVPNGVLARPAN